MSRTAFLVAVTCTLAAPSVGAAPAGQTSQAPSEGDPAIVGGQAATTCQWPTAVALLSDLGLCTGTLIHPRIVLTAAHCGTDFTEAVFGEDLSGSMRVPIERCERNSIADEVGPSDYAFCLLVDEAEGVPLTPVAFGCEGNMLTDGREVAIVGFGEDENQDFGVKRWAMTSIVRHEMGMVVIGGGGTGAWQGDSGGPAYVQLADGGWRTFGITSGGRGPGQPVYYVPMANVVPWVQEQSGIDILPCHTTDGTWQPTPTCGGYATLPTGSDSWASRCGAADPLSPPSQTCGGAFHSEENPPEVRILSPANDTVLDEFPADVTIEIEASDDVSVRAIRLAVDGEVLQERVNEPWTFSGSFPKGTYELVAAAQDWSGNDGQSETVTLYVGEEPDGCLCRAGGGVDGGDLILAAAVWFLLLRRQRERRARLDIAG